MIQGFLFERVTVAKILTKTGIQKGNVPIDTRFSLTL